MTPDVLRSLAALAQAGLHVIPITGRLVGWSEPFALAWPVDAIVAENGSGAGADRAEPLRKLYTQDEAERTANYARMQQVAQRIVREIPGATISRDSNGRETDIAIDHSEFTHLPQDAIERVVALMRAEGMNATVSSIHVNGWYGGHNKLAGARWVVRELLGRELEDELDRWGTGDSTNDVLMFEHFPHSVAWPTSGASRTSCVQAALRHRRRTRRGLRRGGARSSRPARPRSAAAAAAARPSATARFFQQARTYAFMMRP